MSMYEWPQLRIFFSKLSAIIQDYDIFQMLVYKVEILGK